MADEIILCFRGDEYLRYDSLELVYIGTDKKECINACRKLEYKPMTFEQARDFRFMYQSQCNNVGYEFIFKKQKIHEYVDL